MRAARIMDIESISQKAEIVMAELRAGHRLELVQGGHRLGEIVPCKPLLTGVEREAALQELRAILAEGFDLGGWTFENRGELHERD